jgi:hypothetical protein
MIINIIGSKPLSYVPPSDIGYFINNAFIGHRPLISELPRKVVIVAAANIHLRSTKTNRTEADKFYQQLVSFQDIIDETVIVSNNSDEDLALLPKSISYTIITPMEREHLISSLSKQSFPLIPPRFWEIKTEGIIKQLLGDLYRVNFNRRKGIFIDYPPIFRCSTGVLGLVIALNRYGTNCRYRLCGVGVSARTERPYLTEPAPLLDSYEVEGEKSLQKHVYSDVRVIRSLKNFYKIDILDEELMSIVDSNMREFN